MKKWLLGEILKQLGVKKNDDSDSLKSKLQASLPLILIGAVLFAIIFIVVILVGHFEKIGSVVETAKNTSSGVFGKISELWCNTFECTPANRDEFDAYIRKLQEENPNINIALIAATAMYGHEDDEKLIDQIGDETDDAGVSYSKLTSYVKKLKKHIGYNKDCTDFENGSDEYQKYVKNEFIPKYLNENCAANSCSADDIEDIYQQITVNAEASNLIEGIDCPVGGAGDVCPNGVKVDGYDEPIPLEEFVAGVVHAENEYGTDENRKAMAIAIRTWTLAYTEMCTKSVSVNSGIIAYSKNNNPDVARAVYQTEGMVMLYNNQVFRASFSSFCYDSKKGNTYVAKYRRMPSSDYSMTYLPRWYLEKMVSRNPIKLTASCSELKNYGINVHTSGMCVTCARYMGDYGLNYEQTGKKEPATYQEILKHFYADGIEIKKLTRMYINGIAFPISEVRFRDKFYYYHQCGGWGYYSGNPNECRIKTSSGSCATVCSHGCGQTSLAMVISTLKNAEHNPTELTKATCGRGGLCGPRGSAWGRGGDPDMIAKAPTWYGLKVERVGKDTASVQKVVDALATGEKLVIAIMGRGRFTKSGHFIALAGVNEKGEVLVYDPNHRASSSGNWWHEMDVVVKENNGAFWIISG